MTTLLANLQQNFSTHCSIRKCDKKRLGAVLAGILLITVLFIYWDKLRAFIAFVSDHDALVAYLEPYGTLGVIIFSLFLFLQVFVALIPGQAVIIASGYIYGFWKGFLITHLSTVLASQLCYELARRYGRPVVEKLAPADLVDKWTVRAEKQGIPFFMFSFMTPIFPADIMNFAAGLSGLSPRKFWIANGIGRIPSSVVFTLLGYLGIIEPPPWLIVVAIVFTILALFIWKKVGPILEQRYEERES